MANFEPARPPHRKQPPDDEFHETLSQPVPNRTYRSQVDLTDEPPTILEQTVRLVATLLGLLILARFITNLFSIDRTFSFVNLINSATDWAVKPLQAFIPQPTITSGGVFDWPAVAAALVVATVAAILVKLLRPSRA
jgi:uncharacterized protein YggT (Ycf19 family)